MTMPQQNKQKAAEQILRDIRCTSPSVSASMLKLRNSVLHLFMSRKFFSEAVLSRIGSKYINAYKELLEMKFGLFISTEQI
jgi:hypothetical protein